MKDITLEGRVKRGLGIASGLNPNPPVKLGMKLNNTIALQKPFFEAAGVVGITEMHNGTINIDISPSKFEILKPDYEITCEWWRGLTETFWLVKTEISYKGEKCEGYIYYPCPSDVKPHNDYTVEFLSRKIHGVNYGDAISARVSGGKIKLV